MKNNFIVAITGASGSGKTYLINRLRETLGEEHLCLMSQDNYYHEIALQPKDENNIENFDLPESIDMPTYLQDIRKVCEGQEVKRKEYAFNNVDKPAHWLHFKPAPILLLEGLFLFQDPDIQQLTDLKIFMDTSETTRLKRRIIRDNQERGYDLNDVLYRYEKHAHPSYEQFIAPYKKDADMIIPNHHHPDKAIEILATFLQTKIYQMISLHK
ncbi:MAG: uridine kinase [Cytophagales bacterium]|nr:MAG: uridine kinase [Cytophagales bacterium]